MMNTGGEYPVYIPIDLIPEILSRLPAKSVGRFRCVSKQWESILSRQDFTELFFTRSSARPRLLLILQRSNGDLLFFSAPQPQNPYETSLVVTADYHMKLRGKILSRYEICSYASGLIYVNEFVISEDPAVCVNRFPMGVICNLIKGQFVTLPYLCSYRHSTSFFGFDPIDNQFKVVGEAYPSFGDQRDKHKILTLKTGKLRWRGNNHCPTYYKFTCDGICINGVLYYLADADGSEFSNLIVCFDIKSEEFKLIEVECFKEQSATRLINYKGKLGGIDISYDELMPLC
ncbi:PREDICTED: F-box protein At3g57590-like [Camelina sativa]|uniref:F-box protein At3g57590-like n=1 Tax=Camelina sativa TaxID=90675 RepID=A0ABM0YJ11_CAMSA|nr:PREDICTED: F-box protein At3g57590-like [Camelina sativa]